MSGYQKGRYFEDKKLLTNAVYVGGFPFQTRERDLERFFKGYGRIQDIRIKNGYGFVEFEDYRDAADAVYELNGKELLGEKVVVEQIRGTAKNNPHKSKSRYGPALRTQYRLIVENLSTRPSWQDLKDYMRKAGEVTYAHRQKRNEGVVEFASESDMRTAIEKLNDTVFYGRRIRLVEDRRGGRGGHGRSRSASSRSRSRSRRRPSRSRSRGSSGSRSKSRNRSKSRDDRSKSPVDKPSRSRYHSNRSRDESESKSKSPSKCDSRSRSRSAKRDSKSRSRSKSRGSRDKFASKDKSRSRSNSPNKNESNTPDINNGIKED